MPKFISLGPNMTAAMQSDEMDIQKYGMSIAESNIPSKIKGGNAEPQKISRNAPCPCGSGKKYKRCCGK